MRRTAGRVSISALWMLALVSCVAGACSRKDSNTRVMVVVWSDLTVPTELNLVRIDVKGTGAMSSRSFPLSAVSEPGKTQLPVVYELASPDDKAVAFDVTATAFMDASPIVSQAARLSFAPGHRRVLELFLARACRQVSCAADKTCSGGACDRPVTIDVNGLPEYDPQAPWVAPDAGVVGRDGAGGAETRSSEVGAEAAGDIAPGFDTADALARLDSADAEVVPVPKDLGADTSTDDVSADTSTDDVNADTSTDDVNADTSTDDVNADTSTDAVDLPLGLADTPPDVPPDVAPDLVAPSDPGVRLDEALAVDALDGASPAETGQDVVFHDVAADLRVPDDAPADSTTVEVSPDSPTDGCNATESDPANCGACGQACSSNNGAPACSASRCSMATCALGYLDCSSDENTSRDGCETHGAEDPNNCGHCKNVCTSKVCREGSCLATALYGNSGPGVSGVNFTGNYLAGVQVYVPNASVVTKLGVVLFSGANTRTMYLGLYSDEAGNPATLLATLAGPVAVSSGGQEFDVSPVPVDIAKGNYWLLGVWNDTASFASNTGTTVTWRYASRSMGPLPQTAPTSMASTTLAPPNLYIRVAQ